MVIEIDDLPINSMVIFQLVINDSFPGRVGQP